MPPGSGPGSAHLSLGNRTCVEVGLGVSMPMLSAEQSQTHSGALDHGGPDAGARRRAGGEGERERQRQTGSVCVGRGGVPRSGPWEGGSYQKRGTRPLPEPRSAQSEVE